MLGSIDLTNIGAGTCTLEGRPVLTIFSSPGHEVSVGVVEEVPPQWKVDGAPPPSGSPVVTLRPGSAAAIRVLWANQCPQLSDPATWNIGLTTGESLEVADVRAPSCLGSATPSRLEVGPFEPSAGG